VDVFTQTIIDTIFRELCGQDQTITKDAPAAKPPSALHAPTNFKKSKSPLVIPCKFSAVTYSKRLSGTHSVARRVLRISVENKDLHAAAVSGAERQRAGTPSVSLRARAISSRLTRASLMRDTLAVPRSASKLNSLGRAIPNGCEKRLREAETPLQRDQMAEARAQGLPPALAQFTKSSKRARTPLAGVPVSLR